MNDRRLCGKDNISLRVEDLDRSWPESELQGGSHTQGQRLAVARLDGRWRRLATAKRWIAVVGVLCLLDVVLMGIFFERVLRHLPVPSANLCAYRTAGLLRRGAEIPEVKDLVATCKRICPDILVALVVDEGGRIVVSSKTSLEGSIIPLERIKDAQALKAWLSQHAPDTGIQADRFYHMIGEEASSDPDGGSYRIWVVSPPVMYTSWIGWAAMVTYAPEAEWALWSLIWWLSVPTWMYLDRVVATRNAGRSAILWGLAGLVGNGVALLAYLAASRSRRWAAAETADTPIR